MLEQTREVTLSPAAAEAVRQIIHERQLSGYALRVFVAGGGCCGVNYGLALDNNIRADDVTFESDGVRLVVDEISLGYLPGARIDFVHDAEQGPGFVVESLHAHEHSDSEGDCACGGSCSCRS